MILENWRIGFESGKDNFACIEVSIHTVHRQPTSLNGVSHLNGIPFSFLTIVSSEIGLPDYLHVNTSTNVQKCI